MIEIRNLCKSYEGKVVYKDLNLCFKEKEITVLMGPSGIGKTTLLRILAGLESYEKGEIFGIEGKRVAFVFQEDRLMPWLTVRENIEYVLASWMSKSAYQERTTEILEMVGLLEVQNQFIDALSGGMQRRVALGRALAYDSDLLLMDEPFKGLDDRLKYDMIEKIKTLTHLRGTTVICVTHDLEEAKKLGEVIGLG